MSLDDWALVACVVFTGLWSGRARDVDACHASHAGRDERQRLRRFLGAFLPPTQRTPFNYAMVIRMVVSPIVALFALGVSAGAPFVLTAIGLGLTVAGPLLVSNRLAEPNYDVMLAWDPDSLPAGWKAARKRYFALNWIRAAATWAACALPRRASDGSALAA